MSKAMNKAEKAHVSAVVRLGCIVCRDMGHQDSPAEAHHPRHGVGMGKKASHFDVIPLCPTHHRTGGPGIAIHAGRFTWESIFGTESELLEKVKGLL
jgi:hypothetical protein